MLLLHLVLKLYAYICNRNYIAIHITELTFVFKIETISESDFFFFFFSFYKVNAFKKHPKTDYRGSERRGRRVGTECVYG